MSNEKTPRLVLIVSDSPLMVGKPEKLAGRSAIHIPLASPPMPLAAIATTIATGVNPIVHGIVTVVTVDSETEEVREVVASDRRFQAFWTQSGLDVSLINWPATEGDSDATNITSDDAFEKAKELHCSDVVGIVLPTNVQDKSTPEKVRTQQTELEEYLATLPSETHVLLVYKRTNKDGIVAPHAVDTIGATLLIEGCSFASTHASFIEVFGGAIYLLAGIPCPVGVKPPQWEFMDAFKKEEPRPFPITPEQDDTDWMQLIDNVVASKNEQAIAILTQRFLTFMSVAFKKEDWKELAPSSACLIQLRGKPLEYWQHILALQQLGEQEALETAIETLEAKFPKRLITSIAKSSLLFQSKPDEAYELLKDIDPEKIAVFHALGTFGRICFGVGLEEKGVAAIELAMKKRTAIPADRAKLAEYYVEREQYKRALQILGRTGVGGHVSWQVLRMKILVALDQPNQAKQIAANILQKKPAHAEALRVLG